ncbi:MAG: hypothetical protein NWS92_07790 [Crocinitomicaceae bacterium]|jgi:hypothetical protein|nr:hypothetical protein [Crocinitomicaceae bacterium]
MERIAQFQVASFIYGIFADPKINVVLDDGFSDFMLPSITKDTAQREAIRIACHEGLSQKQKPKNLLYSAKNETQVLWEIYENPDGYRIYWVYHSLTGALQQQAFFDTTTKTWHIYAELNEQVLAPLAYPMAPLLWYELSTTEPILMIHASGITYDQKGRAFAGFSGVGKSTLAKLWQNQGATVINDDRMILIREKAGVWRMYNTPMSYRDHTKSACLHSIYLPFHHDENTYTPLKGALAMASLMAFVIHHGYDSKHVLHHMQIAELLIKELPIGKLGVVPTAPIIDFIKGIEGGENERGQ